MIHCSEIDDYIRFTQDHPDKVSEDVHLLIKNVVLPTLTREDITFEEDTFHECIAYCERYFYPLFPFQKFLIAFIFIYDQQGLVVFRKFVWMMGRGNGKDGFAAPVCNFLQTKRYGVRKYNIDIVANAESQAQDTIDVIYDMMMAKENYSKFKKFFYITKEKIVNLATLSRLRINTSNAKTKDGKQTGLLLYNEYHGYTDNSQISTFESGFGKVKHSRIIIITTQGENRDGPLDELLATCDAVLHGEFQVLRMFPFICRLDDPGEVDDPEKWEKANPSIEFRPELKSELMAQYQEMKLIPSKRAVFMTKRMNIPEQEEKQAVTSWNNVLATTYQNPEDKPHLRVERKTMKLSHKKCIVGIDYASIRDFVHAGFLFMDDQEYIWRGHTWICKQSPFFNEIKFPFANAGQPGYDDFTVVDKPSIDEDMVIDWIMEEVKKYGLEVIALDSYRYELLKRSFDRYGITPRTDKDPYGQIVRVRSGPITHGQIAPIIDVAFAKRLINFGNSAIMRWFTYNTMVVTDKKGNMAYEKIEPKLRKNDGFMAFVHAMTQRHLLEEVVFYM